MNHFENDPSTLNPLNFSPSSSIYLC